MRPVSAAYIYPGVRMINYTAYDLLSDVSKFFNITISQMTDRNREREVKTPRYLSMYFMRVLFKNKYSLKDVGQLCGGYDHATVMHAVSTVRDHRDTDLEFRFKMDELRDIIFKKIDELHLIVDDK